MPIHDWSCIDAGLLHHFHFTWTGELCRALNAGLLPPGYSALAEHVAAGLVSDVLTVRRPAYRGERSGTSTGVAVTVAKPQSRYVQRIVIDP